MVEQILNEHYLQSSEEYFYLSFDESSTVWDNLPRLVLEGIVHKYGNDYYFKGKKIKHAGSFLLG